MELETPDRRSSRKRCSCEGIPDPRRENIDTGSEDSEDRPVIRERCNDITLLLSIAPTVIAIGTRAGELLEASKPFFPLESNKKIISRWNLGRVVN